MRKLSWVAGAAAVFAAACAGSDSTNAESTAPSAAASAPAGQAGTFSDEQLRGYLAARAEIEPIQARYEAMSEAERAQARTQIAAIVERHGLTPVTYDAIARQANADPAFANRLTSLQPDTFSDANLRAFAAASAEIEPINRTLAAATPEQRTAAAGQIRAILQRHNLDGATYNAIASRAQSDPAFAERLRALRGQPAPG
jgi:hypothetical protein